MIKQPIALHDRLDGFGRSHYRYHDSNVFQPLDALTTVRTFHLRGAIGHCDFTTGLLAFFATNATLSAGSWFLFKRFDALTQYCATRLRGESPDNVASNALVVPL